MAAATCKADPIYRGEKLITYLDRLYTVPERWEPESSEATPLQQQTPWGQKQEGKPPSHSRKGEHPKCWGKRHSRNWVQKANTQNQLSHTNSNSDTT
ncbi:Hypothetical predicted protein [Pelobates cultripes]|uniref:Uncharacterized protein n=1 Tax=Pelobates cultripes TaxID=61616 RepID=A0AAD1WY55_PELCU|nr:Hypothetical predicted protein [Pelobates cultripes]